MAQKYLDQDGLDFLIGLIKSWGQPELISGTNIKSLTSGDQNVSILGSGTLQFKTINNDPIIGSNNITLQVPLTFQTGDGLSLSNEDNTIVYALKTSTPDVIGGIKIGYDDNDQNYGVKLDDNNRAYVTVPKIEYSVVTESKSGLAPLITKTGEVDQQFIVLASDNGVPGWYSLPATAFSEGEKVTVINNDPVLTWGTRSVLATVNGAEISTSLPSNPCLVLTLKGEIQGVEGDTTGYKVSLMNSDSELGHVIVPLPSVISNSDIDNIIASALPTTESTE